MAENQEIEVNSSLKGVIFKSVPEKYIRGLPIHCQYKVATWVSVNPGDRVAIHPVAWQIPVEPVCEQVTGPLVDGSHGSVTFQAEDLPKEDEEFYQFCYMTTNGDMVGASTPFQFEQKVSEPDLVEEEMEDGVVMIIPKTEYLKRELDQAVEREKALKKAVQVLKQEHQSETQKLVSEQGNAYEQFIKKRDELIRQYQSEEEKRRQLENSVTSQSTVIAEMESTLNKLNKEIQQKDKKAEQQQRELQQQQENWRVERGSLKDEVRLLTKLVATRTADCRQLEEELASLRPRYQEKEEEKVWLEGRIETLNKELLAKTQEIEDHLDLLHQKDSDLGKKDERIEALTRKIQMYLLEKEETEKRLKRLMEKENCLQNQLDALEASKRLMREEIDKLKENLDASAKFEEQHVQVSAKLGALQATHHITLGQLQELRREYSVLERESKDSKARQQKFYMEQRAKAIQYFEQTLSKNDTKIAELKAQKEKAEGEMAQLKEEMATLALELDGTREAQKEMMKRIKLMKDCYETLRNKCNRKIGKVRALKKELGQPLSPDDSVMAESITCRLKASRGPREPLVETQNASQCGVSKPPGPHPGRDADEAHQDKDSVPKTPEELLAACQNIYPNPYISPTAGDNMGEPRAMWAFFDPEDPPPVETPIPPPVETPTPPPVETPIPPPAKTPSLIKIPLESGPHKALVNMVEREQSRRKTRAAEKKKEHQQLSEPEEEEFHDARADPPNTASQDKDTICSDTIWLLEQLMATGEMCQGCKCIRPEFMSKESFKSHMLSCAPKQS